MATVQKPNRPATSQKKPVTSFASEALRMGGKSDDEVARMGAVDAADDRVETLFALRYQTVNSPVHRAVWEKAFPVDLFDFEPPVVDPSPAAEPVMRASLDVVRRHVQAGTLLDDNRKVSGQVMHELARPVTGDC